jgi:aspartate-semialdehyde dehydrogenase
MKKYNVGVFGATGAVGGEMVRLLKDRNFPLLKLRAISREESLGNASMVDGVTESSSLSTEAFSGMDIVLFAVDSALSKIWAPAAVQKGAVVIDNSSAFRMETRVPLVVPEVNPEDIKWHNGIIANPNCTTAIALMALYPLHIEFGLLRIFASSYQAVSGAGKEGISELREQIIQYTNGNPLKCGVFPYQVFGNVIPHIDSFLQDGYTKEERKMQDEGRKIMHHPDFRASITCVRIPVFRAHSISVSAEFERPVSIERAREVLLKAPGLDVVDDPKGKKYPMPLFLERKDNCEVGRIRKDCAFKNGLAFWVCGDQLLKGAALNAVQIAEELIKNCR